MTFEEWIATQPPELTGDRLAEFAWDASWREQGGPALVAAIGYLIEYAGRTADLWDEDADAKVGKRLSAMAGSLRGYDRRLDEIRSQHKAHRGETE